MVIIIQISSLHYCWNQTKTCTMFKVSFSKQWCLTLLDLIFKDGTYFFNPIFTCKVNQIFATFYHSVLKIWIENILTKSQSNHEQYVGRMYDSFSFFFQFFQGIRISKFGIYLINHSKCEFIVPSFFCFDSFQFFS